IYLCSFVTGEARSWLALDGAAQPLEDRSLVRDAVSIAALCEIADETAGGGDLEELRAQLEPLRLTEQPDGSEEAEAAVPEPEQAYRATSAAALEALARDLPRQRLEPRRRRAKWLTGVLFGHVVRRGRWRLPRFGLVVVGFGDADLDLREAEVGSTTVTLTAL